MVLIFARIHRKSPEYVAAFLAMYEVVRYSGPSARGRGPEKKRKLLKCLEQTVYLKQDLVEERVQNGPIPF